VKQKEVVVDLDILEYNKMKIKRIEVRKFILIGIIIMNFLVCEVGVICQEVKNQTMKGDDITNQEYHYAFNEATKYFLFGNYLQAVTLYNECLKIKPGSGAVHYQLSRIFLNTGNTGMAREHIKRACDLSKENTWYLQELGDIFQIEQKYDSAIMVYRKIERLDPENNSNVYNIATLYEKLKNYNEALKYLEIIDSKVGISKEVSLNRYRIYDSLKMYKPALEQIKMAYELSDDDFSIIGIIAEFFRDQNKPDSAYKYYRKIYPSIKSEPVVVFSFAEFLLKNGKIDSAETVLLELIENSNIDNMLKSGYFFKVVQDENLYKLTQPLLDTLVSVYYRKYYDDLRSMAVYADIEVSLRNYQKASNALKRIVSSDIDNYKACEQLIYVYSALGKSDSALYYAKNAVTKFGNKPILYLFMGSEHFKLKEYEKAAETLEMGLVIADNNNLEFEFYSMLAECYENLKNYEKSGIAFENALKINENNSSIKNNYAYYLSLREENLPLAKKMSRSTIEKEPDNSTYLDTYGWVLYKMKRPRMAKKFLIKAINNDGGKNDEILIHYGETLVSLRMYREALIYFNRALSMVDNSQKEDLLKRINEVENEITR
jgi:tetratricopeptide (TPR) repeat protein